MPTTTKSPLIATGILISCLLYGCAAVIIGAGAVGTGVFAYAEGKLSRMYESGYRETVEASIETLDSLKIPVKAKTADELKTIIAAERPDGTPVRVEVARVKPELTEVAVRTGKLGVFDKNTSRQIHDHILSRLSAKSVSASNAPAPFAPESSETEKPPEDSQKPFTVTVYFGKNNNTLSREETVKLDEFVEDFHKKRADSVLIEGYSDAAGNREYNNMLSLSRAGVVQMYLIGKGVPRERIQVFGRGATNFVGDNATEEGRRLNRRVEIRFEP